MKKEFMDSVPDSVFAVKYENSNRKEYCHQFDSIYNGLSIEDLIRYLTNDPEFYKNPTKDQMEKSLNKFLKEEIETFKEDFKFYVKNIMPEFLKGELKNDL